MITCISFYKVTGITIKKYVKRGETKWVEVGLKGPDGKASFTLHPEGRMVDMKVIEVEISK